MSGEIDPVTLANLMRGLYTCYWCGHTADTEAIGPHVDECLRKRHLDIAELERMYSCEGPK